MRRNHVGPLLVLISLALTTSQTEAAAASRPRMVAADQLVLQLDPTLPLPGDQREQVERFLAETLGLLPVKLRKTLGRVVTVNFEALDAAPGVYVPPCVGAEPDERWESQVLGRVERPSGPSRRKVDRVSLHRGFLAEIQQGPGSARSYSCGHRNLYRLALASLVHELGHIYDYANPYSTDEETTLRRCEIADGSGGDPDCQRLRDRHTVTTQPEFLDLMGWVETGVIFRTRNQSNQSFLRSPDPYEFTNPRESFSVNLEYFLMDPEFACRRPAVHRYYAGHFGEDPHPSRSCRLRTLLPLSSGMVGGPALFADLEPSRIFEIHALFAGKGPATMSRWGHSLYRIVRCAPERERPGPECLNDIAHHVVVSFRANVADAAISYLKGLMGGYASLLFAQPFLSVVEEYNKGEFRELISLPLQLSESQKSLFIERVLEASWEYAGRYRFISNNCATEALNFLKGVLGSSPISTHHPRTPVGLHETLIKKGIVDARPLADIGSAQQTGHYLASKKPEVDAAWAGVREAVASSCGPECTKRLPRKVEAYLDESAAASRRSLYDSIWSRPAAGLTRKVVGARFFLLESYVIRRSEQSLFATVARAVEQDTRMKQVFEELRLLQQQKLPSQIRSEGYGIPPLAEPPTTELEAGNESGGTERERALIEEVLAWARSSFAGLFSELEEAARNRLHFLKEMRRRDEPAGGVSQ
jgi:hypothetical protein